jgi:hypothetical protein
MLGYSDTETVKLDFDEMSFRSVKYWASKAMKRFKLAGFLILKSSKENYHAVFNRKVTWKQNMSVVAWVALLSHNNGLAKWFLKQCIKGCPTLRISFKREKPPPRIVYHFGAQDKQIKDFLKMRKIIKKTSKKLRENLCF